MKKLMALILMLLLGAAAAAAPLVEVTGDDIDARLHSAVIGGATAWLLDEHLPGMDSPDLPPKLRKSMVTLLSLASVMAYEGVRTSGKFDAGSMFFGSLGTLTVITIRF